jgi:hypothetical protein
MHFHVSRTCCESSLLVLFRVAAENMYLHGWKNFKALCNGSRLNGNINKLGAIFVFIFLYREQAERQLYIYLLPYNIFPQAENTGFRDSNEIKHVCTFV